MKKYILLLMLMSVSMQIVRAQLKLTLALNSRPQPYLSDWINPINGQMIVTYIQSVPATDPRIKIKSTLIDEAGNIIGSSNLATAFVFTLIEGVNTFSMADALQLSNLILSGDVQNLLRQTGKLVAGQYQLKVELYNSFGEPLRVEQTRPFFITAYQLPILMQPANNAALDAHIAQSIILFRWTSLIPTSQEPAQYLVQVFEVLPGQTPMQAFRSNQPILNEMANNRTTQYIWRPNIAMIDSLANKQFIWTVQTLDSKGNPIPGNDLNTQGRSEPAVFNIVHQPLNNEKKKEPN